MRSRRRRISWLALGFLCLGCATGGRPPKPAATAGAAAEASAQAGCGSWGGQCGQRSPATPVPECVDPATAAAAACTASGSVRLWPQLFRPAGLISPNRDSTSRYQGRCVPGQAAGLELFRSLDIAGNYVFVAYNAGLQVWNVSGPVANPALTSQVDGWAGRFWAFPGPSEQLNFVQGVSAVDSGDGTVLVAASGVAPVGTTLWEYTPGGQLVQLFQDATGGSVDVRTFRLGGRAYALAVGTAPDSLVLYDMTTARLTRPMTQCCLGCADGLRNTSATTAGCGNGIRLWSLPSGAFLHRYLDATVVGGKIHVATSGTLSPMRLWEVTPSPAPTAAALRFTGPTNIHGPVFFDVGTAHLLAWVRGNDIEVFDATACLDANGCTSLGSPLYTRPLRNLSATERFLTFSTDSLGRRYLYFGCNGCLALDGSAFEQLLDVTAITAGGLRGQVVEMTAGGGSYTDPCPNGRRAAVDYWGRYYPMNDLGLNEVQPHIGAFRGDAFYRVAESIFDVHVRVPPPGQIFYDGFEIDGTSRWTSSRP